MKEQIPQLYGQQKFKFLEIPHDEYGEGFFDDFIEKRNFKKEDFQYIDILLEIPKDVLISEYHNFFYSAQDKTITQLEQQITDWKEEIQTDTLKQKIHSAEIYKIITEKYNWEVANSLNRILERLPNTKK